VPTARPTDSLPPEISNLFQKIREAGFPLVGAVDLALAKEEFKTHGERYSAWIEQKFHGDMAYLERGMARRLDPTLVFPETKSVVVCAIPYRRTELANPSSTAVPRYARYLQGPDYHRRLPELLEGALRASGIAANWKICVDTSAVLERSWAALAGLGWIGKNTLLIHPEFGSYLFLATILLDRETGLGPDLHPNYCGHCSACLDGCPTSAFVAPGSLDSRKCISYLTLEKRGEWVDLPEVSRKKMGTWVAGCDICQEVCPYNRKPSRREETWPRDPRDLALEMDWTVLADETESQYRARIQNSALSRIKFPEMRRNVANAVRNAYVRPTGDSDGSPNSSP
jgi:epoxyqueuosine reductase